MRTASAPAPRRLRRERAGVFMLFACFGMTLATWAVHLPSLQRATGMSTAMVGTVLLLSGLGALVGMQVCGPLADRLGSAAVALGGCAVMAAAVLAPLSVTTTAWAAGGALLFGIATGSADVAMNAAAVETERAYGRPIMASFHAVFSLGSVAGSLLATAGFALSISTLAASAVAATLVVVILAGVSGWLRGFSVGVDVPDDCVPAEPAAAPAMSRAAQLRRVAVLGALAFLLLLSEGAAMDWSSLHAQRHFGAQPALGAVTFGCFVTAMTIGRFCADRIAARIGTVAMVRWGCVLAAVGVGVVLLAPGIPMVLVGWLLFGLGLAGGIPQVFTAAGNIGADSGRVLARVVGMGYVAIMAGPALIGWLAELSSINTALVLPLCAVVACALAAPAVAARTQPAR